MISGEVPCTLYLSYCIVFVIVLALNLLHSVGPDKGHNCTTRILLLQRRMFYPPRSEGGADELEYSGRLFGAECSKSTLDSALASGMEW